MNVSPADGVAPWRQTPRAVALRRVAMPLLVAHASSRSVSRVRDVIVVEWIGGGETSGWGECPTFADGGYVTEPTDVAWRELVDDLVPRVVDGGSIQWEGSGSAALAALRDASMDHHLRSMGVGLSDHLGADRRPLERTVVIAAVGDESGSIVRRAREAIGRGAKLVKVKISPGATRSILGPVADAIGVDRLAVDANGSFSSARELDEVDSLGLRYIEQPFDHRLGWSDLGELSSGLRTPLALDESVCSTEDLVHALRVGACSIVSVKPARVGGVAAAADMVALANSLGVGVFVGGMVESVIGRAGALAVAGLSGCTLPTDLGPSGAYFACDIGEPVELDADGRISAPLGPGNGAVVDRALLDDATMEETIIGA